MCIVGQKLSNLHNLWYKKKKMFCRIQIMLWIIQRKYVDILKGPLIFYWRSASIVLWSTHVHIICTLQSLEVQYSRVKSKISKNIKRNLRPRKYDLEDCYRDFDCYVNISISCNVFLAFSYWLLPMKSNKT